MRLLAYSTICSSILLAAAPVAAEPPPDAAVEVPQPGRPSKIAGIVLTSLGGLNTVFGAAYLATFGKDNVETAGDDGPRRRALGAAWLGGGALVTGAGIALLVHARAQNDAVASPSASVLVGPTSAAVRIGF